MKMRQECHEVVTQQTDTAGFPIKQWICYCGTTACIGAQIRNYHAIVTIKYYKSSENCQCTEIDVCKQCKDAFYKGILRSDLLT